MTGSGAKACSVYLSGAATSTVIVSLSSNNAAVTVPAAVTLAVGKSHTGFTAIVSSVSSVQTATLTATASGVSTNFALQLIPAGTGTLSISANTVAFGNVLLNAPLTQSVTLTSTGTTPLTINAASVAGVGFTISGAAFPVTLNPSSAVTLSVQFNPANSGAATGQLTISSNSSTNPTAVIGLSGTGLPVVSAVSCSNASMTGSGTDACTVSLNAAAPSGGQIVSLSSSNTLVTVPAVVTVAAGATSAGFTAAISPFSSAQTATLSAGVNGVSMAFALQLSAGTGTLSISTSIVTFGNVAVNSQFGQALTLTSAGTGPVTISAAALTGAGFTISGATFPVTLNPNVAITLSMQFNPATAGAASGQLVITSNSSTNATATISLSGTGIPVTSAVSCSSASITGSATDACTVTLNAAAASGGQIVSLSSDNAAVTAPATVTVAEGATSAGFTATVSSAGSVQTATLTASANGVSKCFALQLNLGHGTQIYVDGQTGVDGSAGTILSPLKTIQAAVVKANANNVKSIATTIVVNPGVYREYVHISRMYNQTSAPVTIQAAASGKAIIAASDVISNWAPESGNSSIYSSPWQNRFGACAVPAGWPANFASIALRTEMIFVNNTPLTQVMSRADLKVGTFFVDEQASTLHVWPPAGTNMQTALVESALRPQTLTVSGRSNITLRGLVLRHARTCINQTGANVTSSSNVLIDSVQAVWNNWGGFGVFSSSNVTVQNSIASYNGGVGFLSNRAQTTVFNFDESDYNNWRGAQAAFYEWGMGGTKFFAMRTVTVKDHFSYNNQGEGLWFDTDNQNITIDNATLSGNVTAALQIERNEGPITLKNSHLCSSGVGVNILTSENLTIQNNTFYNNGGTNKFQAQIYLAGTPGGQQITNWQTGQAYNLVTTGMVMSGNTMQAAGTGQFDFGTYLSGGDWSAFASTLKASGNHWHDLDTTNSFKIPNGKIVNLAGWQSAVGTDSDSDWGPPATSPADDCAAPQPSFVDFNVNVDNRTYAMVSGKTVVNVQVNSFGSGAVTLSTTGLPSGVTATISQPTLVSGFATLTLTAAKTATAQTVPITLWAVGSGGVHSVTFSVHVVRGV